MTKFEKSYYYGFLLAVFICWSPSNALAYLAPTIFIFWLFITTNSYIMFKNIFVVLFFIIMILSLYKSINPDYVLGNGVLTFFTYSSFLPLLILPTKFVVNKKLINKVLSLISIIIIIECSVGLTQGLYGAYIGGGFDLANGDYFEGTIHPGLDSERSFSNPIFAVMIGISLSFLLPSFLIEKKNRLTLFFGVLVFLLASVFHALIFLFLGFIISYLYFQPKIIHQINNKNNLLLILSLLIIAVLTFKLLLPTNFRNVMPSATKIINFQFPKTIVMKRFYTEVTEEHRYALLFGLGPGQYESRASFISTGKYFGGPNSNTSMNIPFTKKTKVFANNIEDLWLAVSNNPSFGNSSTALPQSSWNAILSEFGLFGAFLIIFMLFKILSRIKKNCINERDKIYGHTFGTVVIFIFFLGFQENYWEVPQAIFIGLLTLKIFYNHILYTKNRIGINY